MTGPSSERTADADVATVREMLTRAVDRRPYLHMREMREGVAALDALDRLSAWLSREREAPTSLRVLLETYLEDRGFHHTYKANADADYWGHVELGEARTFVECVEWQIGREEAHT